MAHWSEQEVSLLKELYPKVRVKNLAQTFPARTKDTIVAKALSLNLPSAKLWQSHENQILRIYFPYAPMWQLRQLLSRRSWKAIIAQGERLGLKRGAARPRLLVNEEYFTAWSSNMAYVLGFTLSDGCIIEGTYKGYSDALKFGVQLQDIDIIEKIRHELQSEHKISITGGAAHFCITSRKIVESLKSLGISYRKSLREKVPNVPNTYIRDFIRGVIDGDGGVSIDARGYPVLRVCGGEHIITFIRNHFYTKFGTFSSIGKRPSQKDKTLHLCSIAYRCNSAQTLIRYLYEHAELYLERKYQTATECLTRTMKKYKTRKRILQS